MPIYEYKCDKCGVFEVTQRITESALKRCPTCKGKVERIISATSFILKGSGWYATDYARSGSSNKSESPSDASTSPATSESNGASGKSETSTTATETKSSSDKSTPTKSAD